MVDAVDAVEDPCSRTEPTLDFTTFYRGEFERPAKAGLLLTGDPSEAEELAQEAFVRVYRRWNAVRTMESPTGYLYRTALNLHRSGLRRLAIRPRRRSAPASDDALTVADDRLDILRAVRSLPRAQREALVLVEWLGLDAVEAGRVLGIAAASVRGRLHRARQALRQRLGGDGDA